MILAPFLLAAAALVMCYILIGYPLLLALCVHRSAPPARKDPGFRTTVSLILAVRNGEEFIRGKLESITALKYPRDLLEILIVSDGSTDATEQIVESFADPRVRLLRTAHSGKPAALNLALRHASGEILFFTDVRQTLDPDALSHLVSNFADPSIGAATGELHYLDVSSAGEEADIEMYWRYELWARRRHSQIDSTFTPTGCLYALRRSLADFLPPDALADDAVMAFRAFLRGYRVVVDPEAIVFDYAGVKGGEFRRKLRTLGGLLQVHVRMPAYFSHANRMRFHFFSHKSARLVLPWAILLAWVATLALPPSPFRSFLLGDEILFVVVAVLDTFIPKTFFLKRLSSPARSFLAMNAAALLSPVVFLVPHRVLWRPTQVKTKHADGRAVEDSTRQSL